MSDAFARFDSSGDDKYDDNGVDQHHCDMMMILILIVMITMKLNARTAWGDGVSHYAARHGTVCMLRFLLYNIKFTFSNYAVCIFMRYDIKKLGRCDSYLRNYHCN